MADKKNGSQIMDNLLEDPKEVQKEMLTKGAAIYASLIEWYRKTNSDFSDTDPAILGKIIAVALNQYTSVVAIDLGLDKEHYLKICSVLYDNAYEAAPKFG